MVTYTIQIWDSVFRKYRKGWEGKDLDRAHLMMEKPYNRIHTRRLIKTTTEVIVIKNADRRTNK